MTLRRIKWIVSLAIFMAVATAALAPFRTGALQDAIDLAALGLAFLVPARWIDSPRDVWRRWRIAAGSILTATMAWDAATAAVIAQRQFLMDWPIVYSTSLIFFVGLLLIDGLLVATWAKRSARG